MEQRTGHSLLNTFLAADFAFLPEGDFYRPQIGPHYGIVLGVRDESSPASEFLDLAEKTNLLSERKERRRKGEAHDRSAAAISRSITRAHCIDFDSYERESPLVPAHAPD
jgi:hypothetical protein